MECSLIRGFWKSVSKRKSNIELIKERDISYLGILWMNLPARIVHECHLDTCLNEELHIAVKRQRHNVGSFEERN